ncbi:fructose-1,6-bisphosphatase class 1 [Aureimonas endophytica]|uniref:Fructose-1,6-bisphosphatase class 1 n=1 Tax=Aureimonas endophytica TaxID=2027858 RepID=A0A916ZIR5_9HYPH|nr:class 1 fructose-bisphosphatase [Aureimonas endophytica]GGD99912.1 fructose-1,6-bisphosphatase class 1 [Aureimonas endophytica]
MALTLDDFLTAAAEARAELRPVAETIRHFAAAAVTVQATIAAGGAGDDLAAGQDRQNAGGDMQKELDVVADRAFLAAAKASPVAFYGSEEQDEAVAFGDGPLALAIDPLDGSSNIETNVSIGTIFSLLPVEASHRTDPATVFRQPGTRQLAAGFFIYGPQLLLVVTLGQGTKVFLHAPGAEGFVEFGKAPAIPEDAKEYAVNASNRRHWAPGVRAYVEDLDAGRDGPRGRDFGMRYVGSMVADAYRIFRRGGVFFYPGDTRKGYERGRLRQLYETNPMAFCIEQAGGAATDGARRMLEIVPDGLHARTPFVFGSKAEVEAAKGYFTKAG